MQKFGPSDLLADPFADEDKWLSVALNGSNQKPCRSPKLGRLFASALCFALLIVALVSQHTRSILDRDYIEGQLKGHFFLNTDPAHLALCIAPMLHSLVTDGRAGSSPWTVRNIEPVGNLPNLGNYQFYEISIEGFFLERPILPSGGSWGFFAFDGNQLSYLNGIHGAATVSSVLRKANRSLEHELPDQMANLLCRSLLVDGNDVPVPITSINDWLTELLNMETPGASPTDRYHFRGYVLNRDEYRKCADVFQSAYIAGSKEQGWTLRFLAWRGWMHKLQRVCKYKCSISPNFEVTVHEEVITDRLFSHVPDIYY